MRHPGEHDSTSSGNDFFLGLLTVAFIVLKLLGYINWSWWWVLSPIWIPLVILALALLILLIWGKLHD